MAVNRILMTYSWHNMRTKQSSTLLMEAQIGKQSRLSTKCTRKLIRKITFMSTWENRGTWNLTKHLGSTWHLYCHHTKLSSNWTIAISSISGAQNLGNWSVLNQSYLITQTEYGSKLPNITNSIDVINVNCDAITDSLVDGQNSNMITVISTDNLIRSFPFLYEPKFLSFSRVTSSTISKIRFYLTDTIGRPINLNGTD